MTPKEKENFECKECGANYEIIHEEIELPNYCPFCSEKILIEEEFNSEDWFDENENNQGC